MRLHLIKKLIFALLFLLLAAALFADTTHKVIKGDTLYSISKKYKLTVPELRAANNLSESDVIKLGQTLVIPEYGNNKTVSESSGAVSVEKENYVDSASGSSEYVVKKGDTLYSIARKNGTTVAHLLEINGLGSNAIIKVGQRLRIKGSGSSSSGAVNGSDNLELKDNTVMPPKAPDTRDYGKVLEYDSNVIWPVANPTITQVKGKISGVQLSAKSKESVTCVHEGTVMFVGTYRGFGQVLFVQSKIGLIYAYTGLGSIKVKKGEYVMAGDKIGTAGIDPLTGKPQITFMVFQNGKPIDPEKAPRSFN